MANLTRGQRLSAITGVVLFLLTFTSWYGITGLGDNALGIELDVDTTANAWQAFGWVDLVMLLAAIAAVLPAVATLTGQKLPFDAARAAMGIGALAALLVAYRILNEPGPDEILDVKYGAWLGLLGCLAVIWGARQAAGSGPLVTPPPAAPPAAPAAPTESAPPPSAPPPSAPPPADPPAV